MRPRLDCYTSCLWFHRLNSRHGAREDILGGKSSCSLEKRLQTPSEIFLRICLSICQRVPDSHGETWSITPLLSTPEPLVESHYY